MNILAIETSTLLGGVAIMNRESGLIAEGRLNVRSTHSERLMTEIAHLMSMASLRVDAMDVFAVSIGPGSFTGLRIGLSTVKGFAFATGKPIVAIPSLEALAWNFPFSAHPVCTLFDARKREVYAALFRWEGGTFHRIVPETSLPLEALLEKLQDATFSVPQRERIVFAGEGALLYRREIENRLGAGALFPPPEKTVPSPANVASIGLQLAERGEFAHPIRLVPFYLRKSEAELKKNA